jgi:aminopeptidase-like protein
VIELIESLLLKNRTIVSADVNECMDICRKHYPMRIHEYASGSDHQSWLVPPEWNVIKAELIMNGQLLASYNQSLLFLAPYSNSFRGQVTKEELINHTYTNQQAPDSFCYEFRLAYNFQRRLKEWRITLPYNMLQSIPEDAELLIDIEVEVKDGSLKIGEYSHGQKEISFYFLSHYCHPAQANDGLSGVAIMLETISRIQKKYPDSKYTYRALVMPETIGSSIYVANEPDLIDNALGAVFSEMGGADAGFQLVHSRRGDTYIDRVFLYALQKCGQTLERSVPFRKGWGNDELVFDSVGVNVPAVSLDRYPFAAYHTHHDNMELVVEERLEETVEVLMEVVDILEWDYIPEPINRVPVYLSRYELYSDWTYQRDQYDTNILLIDNLWSGLSVLDIALKFNIDVDFTKSYIDRFVTLGFVKPIPVTPAYTRSTRFLSNK